MSDALDRASRAAFTKSQELNASLIENGIFEKLTWETAHESVRDYWRQTIRAAVEELREPTQEAVRVGLRGFYRYDPEWGPESASDVVADLYRGMIDAILN
jgi:hypothetical protein